MDVLSVEQATSNTKQKKDKFQDLARELEKNCGK